MIKQTLHASDRFKAALRGDLLYGDDFSQEEINKWYADEAEAYADLQGSTGRKYSYQYHGWNQFHAFRWLPDKRFPEALGFGSAFGHEFLPVVDLLDRITIVDASTAFTDTEINGVPVERIRPVPTGKLPFPENKFDLITCFGVLHHIPNVSFVISELSRVLAPGGFLLVREPVVSMGDWRHPRKGLTKRERGIPVALLRKAVTVAGLQIDRFAYCGFSLTRVFFRNSGNGVFNNSVAVRFDAIGARLFTWNLRYHADTRWGKVRPTSAFLIASKAGTSKITCSDHLAGTS